MLQVSTELEAFVRRATANHDSAHDYAHHVEVYKNAAEILDMLGITPTAAEDMELLFATMCHDVRDHKLEALGLCLSAAEVHAFYVEQLGEVSAAKVVAIHENCSWSKRATSKPVAGDWLRQLLQDADWLEAIGEVGLERCIAFSEAYHKGCDIPARVCEHIHEKLLLIPAELNFKASRDLVKSRNLVEPMLKYLEKHEANTPVSRIA